MQSTISEEVASASVGFNVPLDILWYISVTIIPSKPLERKAQSSAWLLLANQT